MQQTLQTLVLVSFREFERMVLNGSWVDAADCQRVPRTRCDLTLDLGSDSDYNIHVRAHCASEASAWSQLSPKFNRRHSKTTHVLDTALTDDDVLIMSGRVGSCAAVVTVPNVTVRAVGTVLQVSFHKLPVAAAAKVTVWKKDNELQVSVFIMSWVRTWVCDMSDVTVTSLNKSRTFVGSFSDICSVVV